MVKLWIKREHGAVHSFCDALRKTRSIELFVLIVLISHCAVLPQRRVISTLANERNEKMNIRYRSKFLGLH